MRNRLPLLASLFRIRSLCIALLVGWMGMHTATCGAGEWTDREAVHRQEPRPQDEAAQTVHQLFESMRNGEYRDLFFPELDWKHVAPLMKLIDHRDELVAFPMVLGSSIAQPRCTEGVIAMWLIDGIRYDRQFPGLAPILSTRDQTIDDSQAVAVESYRRWWKRVGPWPVLQAKRMDPLSGTTLAWPGGRPPLKSSCPPGAMVEQANRMMQVISVAEDGNHYFVMQRAGDPPRAQGTLYRVEASSDRPVWTVDGWSDPVVYALNGSDTLLRLGAWFYRELPARKDNEDSSIRLYRNGKVIAHYNVANLFGNTERLVPGSFALRFEKDGTFWLECKTKGLVAALPQAVRIDAQSGKMLAQLEVNPRIDE